MTATALLEEWIAKYSNWGRWQNDHIGTANYITPDHVRQAASLVKTGRAVSLALDLGEDGPQTGHKGRFNPMHWMIASGADYSCGGHNALPNGAGYTDDVVLFPLQGGTHWDSLAHVFHNGTAFNGRPATEVTSLGAPWFGTEHLKATLVGRGVLLDIAASKGVESLDDGYAITIDDLESAEREFGVTVGEGDLLFVRTGKMQRARAIGWGKYAEGGDAPGMSMHTIPWVAERKIASIATDTWGLEVKPFEAPDIRSPFHTVAVAHIGLLLGEMFVLDELSQACAEAGAYEMFVSAPTVPFTRTSGGPPAPVAIL